MSNTINSVEEFNANEKLVSAFDERSENVTEKELVQRVFQMGYTIRLGAVKEILSEIKREKV